MSGPGCEAECSGKDLLHRRVGWLLWGLPGALFVMGAAWDAGRAWLWVPSLTLAGLACIANASRCARLHCFLTGPVFLLCALAALLERAGFASFDWRGIVAVVVVATAVGYGFEWMRGRYVRARSLVK